MHTWSGSQIEWKPARSAPCATSTGRITRMERNETFIFIGVEFSEIESPGAVAKMNGYLIETVGVAPVSNRRAVRLGEPRRPGEGLILINATTKRIAHGCIMMWRTQL